jgi:hypothetical protein
VLSVGVANLVSRRALVAFSHNDARWSENCDTPPNAAAGADYGRDAKSSVVFHERLARSLLFSRTQRHDKECV